jgi:hypothetical protein
MAFDHLNDCRVIAARRGLRIRSSESAPLEVRPQARVVSLDEEDIEPEALPVEAHRSLKSFGETYTLRNVNGD